MNCVHGLFTGSHFGISSLDGFSGSLTFLASLHHGWRGCPLPPGLPASLPPLRLDPLDGEQDVLLLLSPGQPDLRNQGIRGEHFGDLPNMENQMNIILLLCGATVCFW